MKTNKQQQKIKELKEFTHWELSIMLNLVRGIIETGDEWRVIEPAIKELQHLIIDLMNDIYDY